MGHNNSKSKHSYNVEPATQKPQAQPQSQPQPSTEPVDDAKSKIKLSPAPAAATPPVVINSTPAPEWINEAQFVEILKQTVPQFSKIQSFSVKPAMGAGENYATLMLRVSIEAELADKTVKPISYMMKVPHDSSQMQEMLQMANFFDIENECYIDLIPKFEQLYKSKGLDITFGPRAYRFEESQKTEPKLKSTVLMYDLGQDGYRNVNRLECLDFEQAKVVLCKLAQYHAASAAYKSLHGPYSDTIMYGMFGSNPEKAMAVMDAMMIPTQKMFVENLKNYDNCEQYRDKLEKYFSKMHDMFIALGQANPNEFNVINHGDCWVNNFLFKFDPSGQLLDMLFVDFQNPRYGHPSADVLYFIMTSVHIDYKLKDFDYFIKYYHDQLIKHLQLLEYKERLPKLVELQMEMYKYGSWALMASYLVLPVVLLDPTETATFENFLGTGESAADFKKQMYTNKRFKHYIEQMLPWLDNRGLLEVYEPPQAVQAPAVPLTIATPAKAELDSNVPAWVNSDQFKELLKRNHSDFKEILDFRVKKATEAGDNYSSIMLSVDIEYQAVNGQSSSASFMLKVPPASSASAVMLDFMLTFKKEMTMYNDVIPQLEQLYQQAGQPVVFAPKSYKLQNAPESDHILLQNLRPAGFKNADRLQGLNIKETEKVLAKLALLHAASAQLYVTKGPYADCLDKSLYNESTRPFFENPQSKSFVAFNTEAVRSFKGSELFGDKVTKILENMFHWEAKAGIYDDTQFNCLNHGDCWTNNVMFKYDAQGEIVDTLFVDFQRSTFNSPALDLYYFLLSSPSFDIKLEKFDYFVRYYHTELQRNLELLKYPRHIPSLKELHTILLKNPLWAPITVATVMSAVLLDPTANASIDTMLANDEEGKQFKKKLFQNDRYRQHAEALYPRLNHRGLLDLDDGDTKSKDDLDLDWLNFQHFAKLIGDEEPLFEKILESASIPATKPGDNYGAKLLKVDIKVQLKDNTTKNYAYMLKIEPDIKMDENSAFNMVPKEHEVYEKYVPAFEQLYQEAGLSISFSPRTYRFNQSIDKNYLLMENLQASGFTMADRMQGLDLEHTKCALKKLAQWHAASLRYKELNGPYPARYDDGMICEKSRDLFKTITKCCEKAFLKTVRDFKGVEEYEHKLEPLLKAYLDTTIKDAQIDEQEFNVLNHADIWTNNIMFKHDQNGQVQETYLLDHQNTKYGNVAQDLYFFLMSSPQLELKIEQFDYLIRWYHENLIENAQLLKYTGFVPDLRQLHSILLNHPIYAAGTVITTLTICLAKRNENLASDLFLEESPASDALYNQLYSNELYKTQAERILPWLNRRGLLDIV